MLHKRQKLKVKFDKEKFLKFDPSRVGGLTGSTRATMGKTTSVRTGTRPVMNDKTNLGPPATANGGGAKGRLKIVIFVFDRNCPIGLKNCIE